MDKFLSFPFCRPEGLSNNWLVAVYQVRGTNYDTVVKRVSSYAVGQSVGTWLQVPGITETMISERQARVINIYETSSCDEEPVFLVRLAFPTENFGRSMSMLLAALVGNDVSTAISARLISVEYPGANNDGYSGPKHDIKHLRNLCGINTQRPIVLNMIKPCLGFSPQYGAELFRKVALGGIDMIKDDELLGSPHYNDMKDRVVSYVNVANNVKELTGKESVYIPNISGTPRQIRENIETILDAGGKACLINYLYTGFDTLKELSDEFGSDIFIMGHYSGISTLASERSGISDAVMLGTFPRICGADAIMTMMPNREDKWSMYNYVQTLQAQSLPMPGIGKTIPTVGGGITPLNQELIQKELGKDIIIGIGGSIQGHPSGTTAGARAAMLAIESVAEGRDLKEIALHNEDLSKALDL
ncbi:MAG: hypothetical protein GX777_05960 [Fastidiosipila sp.]|nr:hypothetical protein [Fastidiosipila sp.]